MLRGCAWCTWASGCSWVVDQRMCRIHRAASMRALRLARLHVCASLRPVPCSFILLCDLRIDRGPGVKCNWILDAVWRHGVHARACCCHEGSDGDDSPLRPRRHTVIAACVLSSQPDHLPRSHSITFRTSASLTACLQLHRRCLKQPNCCSKTIVDKCSVSSDFRRNPQPTSHITLAHHLPRIYLPSTHTTQTERKQQPCQSTSKGKLQKPLGS